MPRYALVPWQGSGTYEDPFIPVGLRDGVDIIDLRPDVTVADGYALASFRDGLTLPPDAEWLADSMDARVSPQARGRLASLLGAQMPEIDTLGSLIVNLLLYPPPGKWGRVQATHRGEYEIHLGDWHYKQPAIFGYFGEENFTKANSTTLGPTFTWTDLVGDWQVIDNAAVGMTNDAVDRTRCNQDTETDNMWAAAEWTLCNPDGSGNPSGTLAACGRYQSGADTAYFFEMVANCDSYYMGRISAGTLTYWKYAIATPVEVQAYAAPTVLGQPPVWVRINCDGSSITGLANMRVVHTQTDTTIATGRRGGMFVFDSSADARFSSFAIGDMRDPEKTSLLGDDFTTLPVAGQNGWSSITAGLTVENGELLVPEDGAYGYVETARRDLTDSFVAVKLTRPDNTAGTGREAYIRLTEQAGNRITMSHVQNQLSMQVDTGDRADQTTVTYSQASHQWFRVRNAGSIVYFDTAPDGKTWTSRAQKTIAGWVPGNMRIQLQAGDTSPGGVAPVARFDKLNVLPLTYASDLAYTVLRQDVSTVKKDTSVDGNPLKIRGVTYVKGFGTHATSEIRVPVPTGVKTFKAVIGIDDESVPSSTGDAVWEIWNNANTVRLYQSPSLTYASAAVSVSINVGTETTLILKVIEGAADTGDHGDWADAKFETEVGQVFTAEALPTGYVRRRTTKLPFVASIAATGLVNRVRVVLRTFTAATTGSGVLRRVPMKLPKGTVSSTGVFAKLTRALKTASSRPVGTFRWAPSKRFLGSTAAVGSSVVTHLGRVLGHAGTVMMQIKPAGVIRLRFRRR